MTGTAERTKPSLWSAVKTKSDDYHLVQWTRQDWDRKSGRPSANTHERYLPKAALTKLSNTEYKRTMARRGFSSAVNPKDVADKVAPFREPHSTRHRRPAHGR